MVMVMKCNGCSAEIKAADEGAIHGDIDGEDMDLCGQCAPEYENWKARDEQLADEMEKLLAFRRQELRAAFWAAVRSRREDSGRQPSG